jgi:DNA-binding LacI/PurR family transcriptional regulator
LAIGFLAAAYELKISVGRSDEDSLRVAGHDNHPVSRYTCPMLTTYSHNYKQIAQKSVEITLALIDEDNRGGARKTILYDGELIMRASA